MTCAQNSQLIRRFYGEIINLADLDAVEAELPAFIAADYVDHNSPEGPRGPSGYMAHLRALRNTFPDFQCEVVDIIAERDRVASRVRGLGTHLGEFLGLKPTNKRVDVRGINVDRIENGRIAEHWGEADTLGMLLAMGLAPPPALARCWVA